MKRTVAAIAVVSIVLLAGALPLFAQETEPDPETMGVDTAQQNLQEISITRFEDPGFWDVHIPIDAGIITHRRLQGEPMDKEPIPAEEEAGIEVTDEYVLGVKASFFKRGATTISIEPSRPMQVPGIVKTLSVWVVGRNFNHRLNVVVGDYYGNRMVLNMGRLNFSGWKQLTVAIPPGIRQRSAHYNQQTGIQILGFVIEPDMMEAFGTYYVYFDDMRAVTDLFAEESRDPDDMVDSW